MSLTEGVATCNKGHCLLIVHCHATEALSYIPRCSYRIWLAIRAFWVHVNKAHLNCGEGLLQFPIIGVTLISKPITFRTPVYILLRFPDVLTPATETKCLKTHRFQSDITG